MALTSSEKQKAYRARKATLKAPAKKAAGRLLRLLTDHPSKLPQFEAFMLRINKALSESTRTLKEEQWKKEHPTGKSSMDVNEDQE